MLAGCSPQAAGPGVSPEAVEAPLPAAATVKLAELAPAVERPANPPDVAKLTDHTRQDVLKAEAAIEKRDFAAAVGLLERAAGFEPDNPRIRRDLGLAYAALQNPGKALSNLRRAAAAAPDDLEVQVLIGRLSAVAEQNAEAILALRTALKCSAAKPENPLAAEALLILGRLLQTEGYWTASLQCYERLEEWGDLHGQAYRDIAALSKILLTPEILLVRRGELLLALREPAKAVKLLQRAYSRNRTDLLTIRMLLKALVEVKSFARAEKLLVDMAAEPALRPVVPAMAESLCSAAADKAMPMRIWRAYRKKHKTDQLLAISLAAAAEHVGATSQAAGILQSVLAEMPGNVRVARLLANLNFRRREAEEALQVLAAVVRADPAAAHDVREVVAELLAAGLPEDSISSFIDKTSRDGSPESFALHYIAASLADLRVQHSVAAREYLSAIAADEEFYPAYESLLGIYLIEGDDEKAGALLKRLVSAGGERFYVHYIRGSLSLIRGQFRDAVEVLERARRLNDRHTPTVLRLAEAYRRLGQPANAEKVLLATLKQQGYNPRVYRRLFNHYLYRRAFNQAGSVANTLLRREPQSVEGRLMQAKLYLLGRRYDNARQEIRRLAKLAPNSIEVKLLAVDIEFASVKGKLDEKDFERIIASLSEIVHRVPRNLAARRKLALLLNRQGKYEQAVEVWGRLYEDTSQKTVIGKAYVAALLQLDNYDKAAQVLKKLLADRPKDLHLRAELLKTLRKLQQPEKAIEYAEAWLKETTDPAMEKYYSGRLLDLYKATEKYGKAQKLLDDRIASTANEKLADALRGDKLRLYTQAKQFDRLVEFGREWIKAEPENFELRQTIISILVDAKLYDKAHKLLDEWLAERGDGEWAGWYRYSKIYLYGQVEQVAEARAFALKWIEDEPTLLFPRKLLVQTLIDADKADEALELVDGWMKEAAEVLAEPATQPAAALATQPAPTTRPAVEEQKKTAKHLLSWCRISAMHILMRQQRHQRALQRVDGYIRLEKDGTDLLGLKASILSELGRDDDALAVMEKALAKSPDDPQLNNNLGYMYANLGVKLDDAERLVRKALAAEPKQGHLMDSLGWVFYKQGRFGDSVRVFDQILEKADRQWAKDPVILDHAGDAYYRLGRKDKALELWRQAVEKAKERKDATADVRKVLKDAPQKIKAIQQGGKVETAPLGEGIKVK